MTPAEDEARWHEWRRGGVGGSDIAALLGLSRYASPLSLYYEKLGLLEAREESARQRIGKRMEALLALEFHDRTGLYVSGAQTWAQHEVYSWARCTVDGFAVESLYPEDPFAARLGTVQMKTDGRFGWPDGIPANIRAQCVWEMGVTGTGHCWLIVMFAGFRVEVFEIPFDGPAIDDWTFMLDCARSFWLEYVQAGVAPPVDDHDATTAALVEVYRDPAGDLEADDVARAGVTAVHRAMEITAAAEASEKRLKNWLRDLLGAKTDLVDGLKPGRRKGEMVPRVIASWRVQESHKINFDKLRSLAPLGLIEQCTESNPVRVLRVPKPKEKSE